MYLFLATRQRFSKSIRWTLKSIRDVDAMRQSSCCPYNLQLTNYIFFGRTFNLLMWLIWSFYSEWTLLWKCRLKCQSPSTIAVFLHQWKQAWAVNLLLFFIHDINAARRAALYKSDSKSRFPGKSCDAATGCLSNCPPVWWRLRADGTRRGPRSGDGAPCARR